MNHADHFLRRAHRRARGTLLAWSLALALLACTLSLAQHLAWFPPSSTALIIGHWTLVIASAFTLTLWARRARRLDALAHARDLDARLALSARLETAAELASDRSALATAQRADAATHLAARPAPATTGWLSGLVLLALVCLFLLSELAFLGFRALFRENPPAAPELTASADLSTLITWKSPESEIKALAIEEVSLEAHISTPIGLRSATLEISVNGQPRLSRPLDTADLAPLARPGDHRLELSLYLDELAVNEFDLVSYHLRAEPVPIRHSSLDIRHSAAVPAAASPLQFIQIRPPREDVLRVKAGKGTPLEKLSLLIGNLKAAQLQLMKQNFLLAHAPIDRATPAWREENTRVAADQNTLAQKTAEAREYAIAEGFPTLVVDNLGQARPLMASAADKITAAQNPAATEPQGQALGLLTACEKLIQKIITEGGQPSNSPPPPKNNDPFKDKQVFKLPPRAETPAGQLEQLAAQQDAASQSLNGEKPGAAKKDPLAEQAELARKLGALAAPGVLSEAAQQKAAEAAKDAADAAQQLKAGDTQAARAPAEAAAQALREAVAAQEAAGRATAQAELETQRRAINEAERQKDSTSRADALAQAAQKLREEAAQQQQTGSAEAALQLAAAAGAAQRQSQSERDGEKGSQSAQNPGATPSSTPGNNPGASPPVTPKPVPGEGGSLGGAAGAAAQAQAALTPRDQALARASRQLNRAAQNPSPDSASEAQLAAQFSTELLTDLAARDVALRLANTLSNTTDSAQDIVTRPEVRDAITQLVLALEAARHSGRRDEQIRRYNPDDLDPAYRPSVETYFEKLSREAAKP